MSIKSLKRFSISFNLRISCEEYLPSENDIDFLQPHNEYYRDIKGIIFEKTNPNLNPDIIELKKQSRVLTHP
jgi:hypothetical protein